MSKETGAIIKRLRESRGLTQQQLADVVGAKTYTTITKWESGENFPKGKDIIILADFFKVSSDLILGLDGSIKNISTESKYDYYPVSVAAGLPSQVEGISNEEVEKIAIPDSIMGKWAGNKDVFMMRVNGESMNNVIPHTSLIAVRSIEVSNLQDGDIVVFSDSHEYSVKRFYKQENRLIFRPDSSDKYFTDYETSIDNPDLKIHGKVVLYIVELD